SPKVGEAKNPRLCACGCGKEVKGWNYELKKPISYVRGHHYKINYMDEELIIELYTQGKQTLEAISKLINHSSQSIKDVLVKHNITIKKNNEFLKGRPSPLKINLNEKEVLRLYIHENQSLQLVANNFNCSPNIIKRILVSHSIPIRKKKIVLDNLLIFDLYLNKQVPMSHIAKNFNCNVGVINRILKENNIPIRTSKEAINLRPSLKGSSKLKLYEQKIIDLYKIPNKSMKDIAKDFGCSAPTIKKVLIKNNVKLKEYSQVMVGKSKPRVWTEKSRQKRSEATRLSYINHPHLRELRSKQLSKRVRTQEEKGKISKTRMRLFQEGKLKSWCKGLTSKNDERVKNWATKSGKTRKIVFLGDGNPFYGKHHSKETIDRVWK
ncbi:MAG: hypothetical protein AABY22_06415, partial [Nanoarchaeota archaeon]